MSNSESHAKKYNAEKLLPIKSWLNIQYLWPKLYLNKCFNIFITDYMFGKEQLAEQCIVNI